VTIQFDNTRRTFVLRAAGTAAFAVAGAGLLAACGDDDGAAAPGTTTTALAAGATTTTAATTDTVETTSLVAMMPFAPSFGYFLHLTAHTRGHFAAENLDVDIQFARSAGQAMQAVLAGQADLAHTGVLNLVSAVTEQGAEVTSVAMMTQRLLYRLVSSPQNPVHTVADLAGKRVGLPSLGGNAEETLRLVLAEAGVDDSTIELVPAGFDAAGFGLIEEGQIDALFTNGDIAVILRHHGADTVEADFGETNPLLGHVLAGRDEYVAANPDVVVRYLRTLDRSRAELEDPTTTDEVLGDLAGDWDIAALQDLEVAKALLESQLAMAYAEGEGTFLRHMPQRWSAGLDGLADIGAAPADLDPSSFWTNDLLDEALAG
jgi:NitT/TauT family transport system substrate-binding protein